MTLLGAAEIRALAEKLDLKPAKALGQNFVLDANALVTFFSHSANDICDLRWSI